MPLKIFHSTIVLFVPQIYFFSEVSHSKPENEIHHPIYSKILIGAGEFYFSTF